MRRPPTDTNAIRHGSSNGLRQRCRFRKGSAQIVAIKFTLSAGPGRKSLAVSAARGCPANASAMMGLKRLCAFRQRLKLSYRFSDDVLAVDVHLHAVAILSRIAFHPASWKTTSLFPDPSGTMIFRRASSENDCSSAVASPL